MEDLSRFNELGRRLQASCASFKMGISSVDYFLKRYSPATVGEFWLKVARDLDRVMQENLNRRHEKIVPEVELGGDSPQ